MTEINDQISTVSTPEEAIEQFVGEQFIEWLMDYIKHEMEGWSSINFLRSLEAKPDKIKKLLSQRYLAIQALRGGEGDPGFLRFAASNLSESDDPEAESPLEMLQKKLDDFEKPASYINIWRNILKQFGFADEEISRIKPKDFTRTYIAELSDVCSTQDWQVALGALASQEWSLAYESRIWGELLARSGTVSSKDIDVFLAVSDPKHTLEAGHLLDKVVFDMANKHMVWSGASRQLELKRQFLDELIQHFE